jgi:lysine 6-dehydrogenase
MRIAVLGAGMVGRAIASDLSREHSVISADIDTEALELLARRASVETMQADLTLPSSIERAVSGCQMAVNAVPGFMGYAALETLIGLGMNVVDIAFFPEDSAPLDALAKQKGVVAVTDMGVAPGMCNVILGHHNSTMKVDSYHCIVGGLPVRRTWPWEYKAPFSPCDVIEEYVRPARFRENGADVVRPALSDPELVEFPGIGTLEAWNSDGLRSLLRTMPDVPCMKEKTLRWPGHIEKVRMLRESGFFSTEPLHVNGVAVSPLEFTSRVLFSEANWKLGPNEPEFTVMRIDIEGERQGKRVSVRWSLYDQYCRETGFSSMARTTGYACTAAVNAVARGLYSKAGLSPAEFLGSHGECFSFMLEYQRARGVVYEMSETGHDR